MPSAHFYNSYKRTGTVQFHDFALFWDKNLSNFDIDLFVIFFTTYLSLRKLFMASHTVPVAEIGGSL